MKHLFLFSALFFSVLICAAQTKVKQTSDGNFAKVETIRTKEEPKKTGKYLIVGTEKLPVYQAAKLDSLGNVRLYVIRTSKKTGKEYRQYLTIEK